MEHEDSITIMKEELKDVKDWAKRKNKQIVKIIKLENNVIKVILENESKITYLIPKIKYGEAGRTKLSKLGEKVFDDFLEDISLMLDFYGINEIKLTEEKELKKNEKRYFLTKIVNDDEKSTEVKHEVKK